MMGTIILVNMHTIDHPIVIYDLVPSIILTNTYFILEDSPKSRPKKGNRPKLFITDPGQVIL